MFRLLPIGFVLLAASVRAQVPLPEGKGKTILDNECQECHGLDPITGQSLSAAQWRSTVNRMVRRGATLKGPDVDALVEYLATYFGPDTVDINSADSAELQKSLGLTETEAGGLINYRKANGPFRDWSDLVKMDQALARRIEPKRDMITFGPKKTEK